MKKTLALTALLAALVVGCNKSTPGGGGSSGTTSGEKKSNPFSTVVPNEGEFKLTAPDSVLGVSPVGTSIKQGETKDKDIGISRGKNVDADVKISFENLPKGVTIEPANPTLEHGKDKVTIKLVAADDAALGKATVKIIGTPSKGSNKADTEWTIKVDKK